MVFGSAEGLDAFAVRGAVGVDVLGDEGGTDEADGLDGGVLEDGVDGFFVAVDYVEDAVGEAGFFEEFSEQDGGTGVALAGLEDEGVAAGESDREHPEGHHRGKVEGRDAGDYAEGLAERPTVDARADLLGVFAFEELGDGGGELDDFEAASDFAFGVGEDFAVLGGEDGGEVVGVLVEEFAEAEEDAGSAERRLCGPVGEGGLGGFDGGVELGLVGEGDLGLDLAGGGVVDAASAA